MKLRAIIIAAMSLSMVVGLSNAATVEELEARVTALEKSHNKMIENVRKTNELINKVSDTVYNIERRQQRERRDDDERTTKRARRR